MAGCPGHSTDFAICVDGCGGGSGCRSQCQIQVCGGNGLAKSNGNNNIINFSKNEYLTLLAGIGVIIALLLFIICIGIVFLKQNKKKTQYKKVAINETSDALETNVLINE